MLQSSLGSVRFLFSQNIQPNVPMKPITTQIKLAGLPTDSAKGKTICSKKSAMPLKKLFIFRKFSEQIYPKH